MSAEKYINGEPKIWREGEAPNWKELKSPYVIRIKDGIATVVNINGRYCNEDAMKKWKWTTIDDLLKAYEEHQALITKVAELEKEVGNMEDFFCNQDKGI